MSNMSYSFCIKKCNMSTFLLTLILSEKIYENYSYSTTHIQNVCFTHFISIYIIYSTITLVLAISIFQFLFPWIDKSKIRPCGDFSNTLKKFAMKSFSLISSICVKSENFAMTQLPGGQYCHQVIY